MRPFLLTMAIKIQEIQRLDACYWSSPFLFSNVWLTLLTTDYPMLITLTQTWSQSGLDRGTVEKLHKIEWKMYVASFLENMTFFLILVWNSWQTLKEHNNTTAAASPLPQTKCHTAFPARISGTPPLHGSNRVRHVAQACRNTPRMWNSRVSKVSAESNIQQKTCEKC